MNGDAPYRYDQPVDDPDLFVGRWDTVRDIATRARRGESFAVLGGTRIGKTSLFEQVRRTLAQRPETAVGRVVVPVFLSAQQFGRLSRSAIFAAVLEELGARLGGDTAVGLGRAVRELRQGDVAEDFAFDHFVAALKRAMADDDSFQLFILLDEVDELRQHDWSKHFFTNHRFLISQSDLRQRVNVMIAGTLSSVDLWNTAGSPFYNVVTLVEMGLVDDDALRELIRVGFPEGLPAQIEADVLRDVGGHPYLTQYVLSRLWEHPGEPGSDTLERIGQQFLRERRGDFQRWWNACNDDARRLFAEIVASRALFKKHTAIEVFAGDVDRVERALDQLLVNGLVREMAPNRFEAGSRLFAHWALERITAPSIPAAQVSAAAVTEEVVFDLPTRLADLLAIWEGRRANQGQLTPVFYRRLGASLEAAGEPLIASDVYSEALERWPQAGSRFAGRLGRALIRGGARHRAQRLLTRRQAAGYQDEDLGDESLPERATAGVAVFVGPAATDTTAASTQLAGQLTHLLDELDIRYGYTSAAAGPELLFAEGIVARKGDLHLVLPCPVDEFREHRVDPVRGWSSRFEQVLDAAATVEVMGRRHALHNRAAVDYARRAALGLATFRARHLGAPLTPMVAWSGSEDHDGVAATVRFWRGRSLDSRILALPAEDRMADEAPAGRSASEHRIVSLLFADTARFSQLDDVQLRRFGDHYLGKIAELVDRSSHAPVVKNTWGDGLYMVFLDVRDAGLFALELSDLFHRTDWQAAGMPPDLRTRVGLHVGPSHSLTDPLTGQFTFMGHHVSRAARIEQITPPGSVYASRAFAALAAAEGLDDFACEYAGRKPLPKGYGTFPVHHLIRNLSAVLGVFLIALLSACPGEPGGFGSQDDDDYSGSTDDDDDTTEADDLNVVEVADPGAEWPCFDVCCNEEYLSLSERAEAYSAPITSEELLAQLDAIDAGEIPTIVDSMEPDEFAAELREAMNVDFLLDGIDERLLIVRTIGEAGHGSYTEHELLFDDDYVGTFHGILLVPEGKGPHPAVVALHGHEDNAMRYRDEYNAIHLAQNGYAVLMLSLRAMDVGPCESDTTVGSLLQGYTFMAMRTYESTLALKYLRYLDSVDDRRIGLIGHSGGSIACNLTTRVVPGFSALVSDLSGEYHSGLWTEEWFAVLDETAPSIYPYHDLVNDFSTSEAPILTVPYDHATTSHGAEEILEFFDWSLAP